MTWWESTLKYLGEPINICCTVRSVLRTFFGIARLKWIKRNRRLFLQGKRMKRFSWTIGGVWDATKNAAVGAVNLVGNTASIVGNAAVGAYNTVSTIASNAYANASKAVGEAYAIAKEGIKTLKNKVVDGIDWAIATAKQVTEYVTRKVAEIFKPIGDILEKLKHKFIGWLMRNPYFQSLGTEKQGFLLCIIGLRSILGIVGVVTGIMTFFSVLAALLTPVGWVTLVINLICGWTHLKRSIEEMKLALAATIKSTKYHHFGRWAGHLISAIGGRHIE